MQNKNIRTIPLGAAAVTVINAGDMLLSLAEVSNVPESEWRPRYSSAFERPLPFPSQKSVWERAGGVAWRGKPRYAGRGGLAGQAPPLRFTRAIPKVVGLCSLEWELRWELGKPGSKLQIGLLPGRCVQRPYSTECGPVRRLLRISIAD